jgi:hypothetical protein
MIYSTTVSYSFGLLHYFWLAINILFCLLQILAAVLLFRERGTNGWMMLIGGVLSGITTLTLLIVDIFHEVSALPVGWATINRYRNVLGTMATCGQFVFLVGLVLYALRRRAQIHRIAELEQIIAAQNSRLQ